jgi:hypothetical protein
LCKDNKGGNYLIAVASVSTGGAGGVLGKTPGKTRLGE